jgi:hypothetical protein
MQVRVGLLGVAALVGATVFTAAPAAAWGNDVYVPGYSRSNGTYVDGHYRTKADGYSFNNYSYSGNINPYTGSVGTKHSTFDSYSSAPRFSSGNSFGSSNSFGSNFTSRPSTSSSFSSPSYSSSATNRNSGYSSSYNYGSTYSTPSYGYGSSTSSSRSNSSYDSSSTSFWSRAGSKAQSLFSRLPFHW